MENGCTSPQPVVATSPQLVVATSPQLVVATMLFRIFFIVSLGCLDHWCKSYTSKHRKYYRNEMIPETFWHKLVLWVYGLTLIYYCTDIIDLLVRCLP
jgi:hypothetical protein